MSIKAIDTFISDSVKLFEANPSQSLISITYQPTVNTTKDNDNNDEKYSKKRKIASVTFKTSNPHISSNYKFKTLKAKDVSRLLYALGPRGVTINQNRIAKRNIKNKENNNKKTKTAIGLATLLVNTKVEEYDPTLIKNASNKNNTNSKGTSNINSTTNNNSKSTSGKKKKNKKKR